MSSRINFGLMLFSVLAISLPSKAIAAESFQPHTDAVSWTVVINACPDVVFDAIKKSRYSQPAYRKVLATDEKSAVLEETFKGVPVLGDVNCKYKEIEYGIRRIEYQILTSDKFRAFDGAWELEPVQEGRATLLKLSSHIESQIRVPFAKQITAIGAKKDVKRRLNTIKDLVEQKS
ncbi:MAG: SRPBCC family protein [Candidatus Melainabacteria bacterium]|nr:SRPBCC family protein [Candidatus Melainabacteria bacterium]